MVGLPCSGKTTLAKKLEQDLPALRLTPDEWHIRLFGFDLAEPEHDERHTLIEAMMWDVAARALTLGVNVILDYGFWALEERQDYRARAKALGAKSKIHFLNVSREELLTRLETRNLNLPKGSFPIPKAKLEEWISLFQSPLSDERQERD
jgi:predicted kinase